MDAETEANIFPWIVLIYASVMYVGTLYAKKVYQDFLAQWQFDWATFLQELDNVL